MSRVEFECRLSCKDDRIVEKAVNECQLLLGQIWREPVPAPHISSRIHRCAYRTINDPNPYHVLKEMNNREALEVADAVNGELTTFRDHCLAAIIANTLDYGSAEHQVTDDFVNFFGQEYEKGLNIDDTPAMEQYLDKVVYFCDNCGEIIFDSLLIRHLHDRGADVTVVVRGAPIINDATMEDAIFAGIDQHCTRILPNTTGIAELGYYPPYLPEKLREALQSATLIISKGMANYESFSEFAIPCPVAYLMSVKCQPVADAIGVPKGSRIALLRTE